MSKLVSFVFVIFGGCFAITGAIASDIISAGSWEGYKGEGSTYQAFFLTVEEEGNGFYGFMPDISKSFSICFPITKETMVFNNGYFTQKNVENGLEFIVVLGPSVDKTIEVMRIMRYPDKNESFAQTMRLIPISDENKNRNIVNSCKGRLE